MTDEATEQDMPAAPIDAAATAIVEKLRADLKPKREWRVTKASLEAEIASLERLCEAAQAIARESLVEARAAQASLTRYAAAAFLLGCGFGGAIFWGLT